MYVTDENNARKMLVGILHSSSSFIEPSQWRHYIKFQAKAYDDDSHGISRKNSKVKKENPIMTQDVKPHDRFVSKAMARPRVSKEFFEAYLPSEVRKLVDLDTLRQCNTKLLSNILGEGIVDFLYSVKCGDKDGYISILLEHQTKSEKYMTFRIQKYILGILEEHLREHPNSSFPLIFPMILYAGKDKYTAPRSFYDLFDNPVLAKKFLTEDVMVTSIRDIKDEDIREKYYIGAMLHLMKHITSKDIYPYLEQELPIFKMIIKEDFQYIEDMVYYVTKGAESKKKEKILSLFEGIAPPEKKGEDYDNSRRVQSRRYGTGYGEGYSSRYGER